MPALLYHSPTAVSAISPFDEAILRVARSGPVRIVSPYIGINYLERIISLSPEWRLISDVQEWLASLSVQARPRAWQFIRENLDLIHHCPAVHAKAVISDSLAMMGSANLTQMGILGRTEMGILLNDPQLVAEMGTWFDDLWAETAPPVVDEASTYIQWLDEEASQAPARRQRFALSSSSRKVRARLVKLDVSAPLHGQTEDVPLNLSQVAQAIIAQDQKRYDSLESALEAAIDELTARGSFTFGDLLTQTRSGFTGAGLREIYFLLVQHCANHVRSVFAESTINRLILSAGRFAQSTRDTLPEALDAFDYFLVTLIGTFSFSMAHQIPGEEILEKETGFCGRDQIILTAELLECGFLSLDDRPGELPQYQLDKSFEGWDGRFKLFANARAAWTAKHRQKSATVILPNGDEEEPADEASIARVLRRDALLEFEDTDLDAASIDRMMRETDAKVQLHTRQREEVKREQVDALLAKMLPRVRGGQRFGAYGHQKLIQFVAQRLGVPANIVSAALGNTGPHPRVFVEAHGPGKFRQLEVNSDLTRDMLEAYPQTLAVCDRILKG